MTDVKGSALSTIPLFIKGRFGEPSFQKWLRALSPKARELYGGLILSSAWYPVKEFMILPQIKMCKLFFKGNLKGAREAGRFSAEQSLRGIYKIFVKIGSPEFVVSRGSKISSNYYKPSSLTVVKNSKGHAIFRITQFEGIHKVIEYRMAGWMEKALEISGAKDIKINISKSLTTGDPYTEFIGTWR